MYRRRLAVPPEAASIHRLLRPIAEDLNGRIHDDDGRILIEWFERFWPHPIAGHGRSDGFRWAAIGSNRHAHVLVLITQSLLDARTRYDLDVIVVPRGVPAGSAGARISEKGDLSSLTTARLRSLVDACGTVGMPPPDRNATTTFAAERGRRRGSVHGPGDRVARLEEGRDIPDYDGGSG
ncbi:MAG: hypothetical protein JNK04_18290 [Myxococcales bacterium]|nr:hypothetical protein [Myxococcales bacterium]